MSSSPLKRVYKTVQVAEIPEGFAVHLDGRPVRTPAGKPLVVEAHCKLVETIAREWDAQMEIVRPSTMPLTQLAATAIDRVGPERPAILEHLVAYAQTDLLCYRVEAPVGLRERQDRLWQPLVDWLRDETGAALIVTDGILAVDQPEEALGIVRGSFDRLSLWHLTAAQAAAAASGSAVLALALVLGRLDGQQVYELSQVDETWQVERWGEDAEAVARKQALHADIMAADSLLRHLS